MRVRLVEAYYIYLLITVYLWSVQCHIPDHLAKFANKIEEYCSLSQFCIHDTIRVCGVMGDKKRTFMDHCDMLEFVCDNSMIYAHVDDEEGCPSEKRM